MATPARQTTTATDHHIQLLQGTREFFPALIADLTPGMRLNGRQPAIIHFTGPEKPWTPNTYHPWSWLYWRALARTPFFAEVSRTSGIGFQERARLLLRWLRKRRV